MSEVISLSTFHNHNLTDQDHALFMQTVTSQSGLFYGCEVTLKDENTLHVSTGEGIACGRIFRIMDMDYPVELSASGDLLGRLYVHIDTALDDTPAQLMDVQGSTLPALIQEDDMNQSTGVYEIELATFSINELGISNLEFTAPKATGGGAGGKSIAPDYSATESYEKGRIFFQNGTLYKTIAAIPAGAPLVIDTNVVETSLAAEIEALNQNLTNLMKPWRLVDTLTITTSSTQYNLSEDLHGKHILLVATKSTEPTLVVGSQEMHGELGYVGEYVHLTTTFLPVGASTPYLAVVSFGLVANTSKAYSYTQNIDVNILKIYVKD